MAELVKIQAKIVSPLIVKKIYGVHRAFVSILNPHFDANSKEDFHKKWLPVYFNKWAGLGKLLQKNRVVNFEGEYRTWEFENIGLVFLAKTVKEITYDDIKPIQPQEEAPELEF